MNQKNVEYESDFSKKLDKLSKENKHNAFYYDWIDNTDLDVKYKNILKKLLEITEKVGSALYSVGKIALNAVMKIVQTFPRTAIGIVVGYAMGCIIGLIPFVGPAIASVAAPILALIGGATGFLMDASNFILKCEITNEVQAIFNTK